MDRVLPGESLPRTLSIPGKRVPQSSNRINDRSDPSVVRDVWSREFSERTSATAHKEVQNLRLDGLLTLIAIAHGNLGWLMNLTHYPEQMKQNVKRFYIKRSTDSLTKVRDLRHTLIQYLLQQNHFGTGEDETIE